MNTLTQLTQTSQRAVCLVMSVAIVTLSLAFGAYGMKTMENVGYSVTVTQLQ